MPSFIQRLTTAVQTKRNGVLVGLDPRYESLPPALQTAAAGDYAGRAAAFGTFCRSVIDVVAPLVPIVKPQAAFFEELGPAGMVVLCDVIQYARTRGLLVLVDGKRNDIGTTGAAYAAGYLGIDGQSPWGADSMTVNPYMGSDSLEPFVQRSVETGSGIFVLVKTSNPGGAQFQDLVCDGKPLYRHVADYVEQLALQTIDTETSNGGAYGAVGAVVGATYPAQLAELRAAMPHTWFLVPGYGAQGGAAADVAPAFDANGLGAVVNNSRGIIFAHARKEYAKFGAARWQEAVEAATRQMMSELPPVRG
ncbi:MAG: orotidine-5'-phosphate decarboxylase [Planctomycetota bacterium]|nr:orotidine-5'-phosphate decarboxylase [Planctomycetota bacterium]